MTESDLGNEFVICN